MVPHPDKDGDDDMESSGNSSDVILPANGSYHPLLYGSVTVSCLRSNLVA